MSNAIIYKDPSSKRKKGGGNKQTLLIPNLAIVYYTYQIYIKTALSLYAPNPAQPPSHSPQATTATKEKRSLGIYVPLYRARLGQKENHATRPPRSCGAQSAKTPLETAYAATSFFSLSLL